MGIIRHFSTVPLARRIWSYKNLRRAFAHIRDKGGPSPGVDGELCKHWMKNRTVHTNITQLRRELEFGDFRTSEVKEVYLRKEDGKKRRISVLCLRDKVVARAAYQVLSQVFDARFHHSNFAYRPHRNAGQAAKHCQQLIRHGCKYWVKTDITNCFASFVRSRLKKILKAMTKCEYVFSLLEKFVDMETRITGIAQGGSLSPFFANAYLDRIDQELSQKGFVFAHYGDDYVIGCHSLKSAQQGLRLLRSEVKKIGLSLHEEKTTYIDTTMSALNFCGFKIRQENIGISPQSVARMQKKAIKLVHEYREAGVDNEIAKLQQSELYDDRNPTMRSTEKLRNSIVNTTNTLKMADGIALPTYKIYLQQWKQNFEAVDEPRAIENAIEPVIEYLNSLPGYSRNR